MKKNILICGASKNLGKFLSEKFLNKSNSVIQISRTFKTNIKKNIYKCDLSLNSNTFNVLQKIKKKFSSIDAIIFSTGDSKPHLIKLSDVGKFEKSFRSNLLPIICFIDNYLKIYKNKKTNIIAISSIAGKKVLSAPIEYSVAKSALNYYCKIKAKELARYNIRLNVISPGNILMPNNTWDKKIKSSKKEVMNYISTNVPTQRFVQPEEIYEICKFFIEKELGSLVGSNFVIDGGQSL
jgi:acetoacetyl-CoA reductase